MREQVTVGILTPFFAPQTGYESVANDLDVNLVVVTPERIRWKTGEVQSLIWNGGSWDSKVVPLPQAMYNRFYGPKPQVISALEKILGRNKVFNHVTHFDKWELYNILVNSSLRTCTPPTALYTPNTLASYLRKFKYAILKPRLGHLGYKVLLVSQDTQGYHLYQGSKYPVSSYVSFEDLTAKLKEAISPNFLVQRFIPLASLEGKIFDLRCLVQKDGQSSWTVTGLVSRVALSYSYITNISQAILPGEVVLEQAFPHSNLLAQIKEISIKGAQIAEQSLGSLGEISVDLGLDDRGQIWIIELNGKPMKGIFRELQDTNTIERIFQMPLAYARHLATT